MDDFIENYIEAFIYAYPCVLLVGFCIYHDMYIATKETRYGKIIGFIKIMIVSLLYYSLLVLLASFGGTSSKFPYE